MGKTRFGRELLNLLLSLPMEQLADILGSDKNLLHTLRCCSVMIYIEFNGAGDAIKVGIDKKGYGADQYTDSAIAFRLLARGVFGVSTQTLRGWICEEEEIKNRGLFDTNNVLEIIGKQIRHQLKLESNKDICIFIHLDEHQIVAARLSPEDMKVHLVFFLSKL